MNRLDADIDDSFVRRIDGHGSDVPFENTTPAHAGIVGSIKAVLRDAEKNDIGPAAKPVDRVNRAGLEGNCNTFPRMILRLPDKQTFLCSGVDTNGSRSGHDIYLLCKLRRNCHPETEGSRRCKWKKREILRLRLRMTSTCFRIPKASAQIVTSQMSSASNSYC